MTIDTMTLLRADYRDTLAHVAALGGADLIAFSPPYCDARSYGMDVSWGDADYAALGDAVFAALKPGGHALVNVDAPVREWRPGFGTERGFHPWRMMLDWAERVGFRVPDRLVFGRDGQPGLFPGRFRSGWEPLLWFQRPPGPGYVNPHSIARPAVQAGRKMSRHDGRKKGCEQYANRGTSYISADVALPTTLWDYGSISPTSEPTLGTNHPARWPLRLARDIVLCFCPPGGLVCDPFVGAGTTAVAAVTQGRRFVGGDLGARQEDGMPWVDVARDVVKRATAQQTLFGGAA
jgi:adenine-specific DNA-methyltransferase